MHVKTAAQAALILVALTVQAHAVLLALGAVDVPVHATMTAIAALAAVDVQAHRKEET